MNLREFYREIGESYDDVLSCLGKEELIKKVLNMLPKDENIKNLEAALKEDNYEAAFRCAHTLKGVGASLRLGELSAIAGELTEVLRDRQYSDDIQPLFEDLKACNEKLCQYIDDLS